MRILQIITRLDSIGGAQRHVAELCMAAVEQGHELHLAYGGEFVPAFFPAAVAGAPADP